MRQRTNRRTGNHWSAPALAGMITLLLLLLPAARAQGQADGPNEDQADRALAEESKSRFIFVFDDSVPKGSVPDKAEALAREHAGQVIHHYKEAIRGFSAKMAPEAADRLARKASIAYYEPDQIFHTDVSFSAKGKPPKPPAACTGQSEDWGVTRVGGHGDGTGKTAWVIDTGVDLDHRDLNVDKIRAKSYVGKNADDGNGHGTHVAGIIGAINNNCDTVGVAAGASIVPVRVLGSGGSGLLSDVIAGVDYVAGNAAPGDVANMSLGGGPSPSLDEAVLNAADTGILFTIAAGNESSNASNSSPADTGLHKNVYTVSAIDSSGHFASFSNFGPPVDYAAPGVGILSLYKGGGTAVLSGTSMAAPHVAGILLVNGGTVHSCGSAIGDPDTPDDPIACR